MSFELTGKLLIKNDTQQVSDRFKKREFVVLKEENVNGSVFTDYIKFQLTQDRCELMDSFNVNDELKVTFNIRGNKWEKSGQVNYFTNLDAWRVEAASETMAAAPIADEAPFPTEESSFSQDGGDQDDLPF